MLRRWLGEYTAQAWVLELRPPETMPNEPGRRNGSSPLFPGSKCTDRIPRARRPERLAILVIHEFHWETLSQRIHWRTDGGYSQRQLGPQHVPTMLVYVCVCTCVYVLYTCVLCIYVYACMHIYIYMYTHTHKHLHTPHMKTEEENKSSLFIISIWVSAAEVVAGLDVCVEIIGIFKLTGGKGSLQEKSIQGRGNSSEEWKQFHTPVIPTWAT